MAKRCRACSGVYQPTNSDGSPYFHACPPDRVTAGPVVVDGAVQTPEVRTPIARPRNENYSVASVLRGEGLAIAPGDGADDV